MNKKEHFRRVVSMGCIACRKIGYEDTPAEIHHIRHGQGIAQRAHYTEVIPLCPYHHRYGKDAIHQNKTLFYERFGAEKDLLDEVNAIIKNQTSVSQ